MCTYLISNDISQVQKGPNRLSTQRAEWSTSKVELDQVCVQVPSRVWWADSGWKMRRKTKGPTFDNTLKTVVQRDWLDYPVGIRQEALKRTELPSRLEQQTQDEDEDLIMKKR